MAVLMVTTAQAAPPYRYYLSSVIGSGVIGNTDRVSLSSYVGTYATMTVGRSWGLVYTPDNPVNPDTSQIALPLVSLDSIIGLPTAQRNALQVILNARNVSITLSATTTLESVVTAIGRRIHPSFSLDNLFAGSRPRTSASGNTVLFADTFNVTARGIGAQGLWSVKDGDDSLVSIANQEVTSTNSAGATETAVNLTSLGTSADYYVAGTTRITNTLSNVGVGVQGRMSNNAETLNSSYQVDYDPVNLRLVMRSNTGALTDLGTFTIVPDTDAHRLTLGMIGTTISTRLDGVERISVTNGRVTGPGYGGIRLGHGANVQYQTKIDNFCVATTTAEADTAADCVVAVVGAPRIPPAGGPSGMSMMGVGGGN